MPTRCVNLYAGPGTGKSTTAAALFALMKGKGLKVELVTEYAKDLVYEGRDLANQFIITAEQYRRMARLADKVDWIVTDSPLMLGWAYAKGIYRQPWFLSCLQVLTGLFHNTNVFLRRVKPYAAYGRVHDEQAARELDRKILGMEPYNMAPFHLFVDADENAAPTILKHILRKTCANS